MLAIELAHRAYWLVVLAQTANWLVPRVLFSSISGKLWTHQAPVQSKVTEEKERQ